MMTKVPHLQLCLEELSLFSLQAQQGIFKAGAMKITSDVNGNQNYQLPGVAVAPNNQLKLVI